MISPIDLITDLVDAAAEITDKLREANNHGASNCPSRIKSFDLALNGEKNLFMHTSEKFSTCTRPRARSERPRPHAGRVTPI